MALVCTSGESQCVDDIMHCGWLNIQSLHILHLGILFYYLTICRSSFCRSLNFYLCLLTSLRHTVHQFTDLLSGNLIRCNQNDTWSNMLLQFTFIQQQITTNAISRHFKYMAQVFSCFISVIFPAFCCLILTFFRFVAALKLKIEFKCLRK